MISHRASRPPRHRAVRKALLSTAVVLPVLAGVQAAPSTRLDLGGHDSVFTATAKAHSAHALERSARYRTARDDRRPPSAAPSAPSTAGPSTSSQAAGSSAPGGSTAPVTPGSTAGAAPSTGSQSAPATTPFPAPATTPVAAATGGPAAGRTLAFHDEFDTLDIGPGKTWGYKTTSYEFGDHNPNNYKRDWVTPDAMKVEGGMLTMTATPRDSFYWNTGLLTTQNSFGVGGDGFRVQAGDFLVNRVMLPTGNTGAWPGLWTWDGPGGEVDAFEWHTDVPDVLEFTNHVRPGGDYHRDSGMVAAGRWVWIGVQLGVNNDTWYVGDTLDGMRAVYSDQTGIGSTRPYVIVNLSVNDSPWHPSPSGSAPITYKIDSVRVYR